MYLDFYMIVVPAWRFLVPLLLTYYYLGSLSPSRFSSISCVLLLFLWIAAGSWTNSLLHNPSILLISYRAGHVFFPSSVSLPTNITNMPSILCILAILPAILATAHAQGVIKSAQGTKGSPASAPLQVLQTGNDANIINKTEILDNIVNECGRTLANGNIDVGQNTETLLANKSVTSVTKGGKVAVTMTQGGALGAGPYSCDVDFTSNADAATGQTNATVKETDNKDGTIGLALTMPSDLACVGGT